MSFFQTRYATLQLLTSLLHTVGQTTEEIPGKKGTLTTTELEEHSHQGGNTWLVQNCLLELPYTSAETKVLG